MTTFQVPACVLREGLATAVLSADHPRNGLPALQCVQVAVRDGRIRFAATDRYRLSVGTYDLPDGQGQVPDVAHSVRLPDVRSLVRMLPARDSGLVTVTVDDREATFTYLGSTLVSDYDGGEFPRFESLIPTEYAGYDQDGIVLNPALLNAVTKLPAGGGWSYVTMRGNGARKPAVFTASHEGAEWLVLVMPIIPR